MAALDHDGAVLLPRRITLGNLLSIGSTVIGVVVTVGVIYGVFVTQIQALQHAVEAIPATYARQGDLDRTIQDWKAGNADLRSAVSTLLDKESSTNASVAALTASVGNLRDDIGDVRRRLEAGQGRREDGGR